MVLSRTLLWLNDTVAAIEVLDGDVLSAEVQEEVPMIHEDEGYEPQGCVFWCYR